MKLTPDITSLAQISLLLLGVLALGACTTTEIDEFRQSSTDINISGGETIVILGRRQNNKYETEDDFVACIGDEVASGRNGINVVPEREFMDALFPFFEPRTAPMRTGHLEQLMSQEMAANRIDEFGIEYIVWVDGLTERSGQTGTMTCAIGPGGGGCFGFGSWVDDSNFEAEVWDMDTLTSVGSISASANGQSYLPAVVIPIPLIARVEANACKGLGSQLKAFLNGA